MEYISSMENILWLIWLGVGVAFIVAELAVSGFIIVFFGIGALIAGVTSFFVDSIPVQLMVFGISSLLLILLFRKTMAATFSGANASDEDEVDNVAGQMAEVTEAIEPPLSGRIKFQGSFWKATSTDAAPVGSMVFIIKRDDNDVNAFLVTKEK